MSTHGDQQCERPLTILHLATSFRWTGVAEPAVQLARQQAALGHRVVVAMEPGGDFEARTRAAGLEVNTRLLTHRFHPWAVWQQHRLMRAFIEELRPDVVHAHLLHDHWMAGLTCGYRRGQRPSGAPVLVRTFHREEEPRADPATRWLAGRTSGMIAISQSLAGRLQQAYAPVAGGLLVSGGAVDADEFKPGADPAVIRGEWGIPLGIPVVGLLSRLREARGIFWLLDAVEPLLRRVPQAVVVFCGRGRHADELAARIAQHPLRDSIRFPGYVPPDRLNEAYAALDVHCLLGPGNDGTCRAALQSMACERPLCAFDGGAMHDLLNPGSEDARRAVRLVTAGDVGGLADALASQLLASPAERQMARESARRHVLQHHTPHGQAQRVVSFYRSVSSLGTLAATTRTR